MEKRKDSGTSLGHRPMNSMVNNSAPNKPANKTFFVFEGRLCDANTCNQQSSSDDDEPSSTSDQESCTQSEFQDENSGADE